MAIIGHQIMRTLPLLLAFLPLTAVADEPESALPPEVIITATRQPHEPLTTAASVSRIEAEELASLSAKHQADALNRSPGVYIQRGSGAESLAAIRSPVLAGAGACGAFLITEDNLPTRPVGFCNLNEMFELNYEQADAIEVLRGPGSAMFGASAVHGIVNVLTPRVIGLDTFSAGFEGGSDSFKRIRAGFAQHPGNWHLGAFGSATRAPGWRDSSGVEDGKLNLLADTEVAGGELRLRAAGTKLEQETAGFVQGYNAYRDEELASSNPNPEAFRDATSARVSAHFLRQSCFQRDCRFELAGMYRRSRMDFLQHFLVGKPLEHNAQTSYFLTSSLSMPLTDQIEARISVDAETANSELTEFQPGPATDGTPAANAIRPAGLHYDYEVDSSTLGGTLALEYRFAPRWAFSAALRADRTEYDYDNQMIDGNTAANGIPCGGAGCLFSRPADRRDDFSNLAPRVTLSWQPGDRSMIYISSSSGFRPPEMTELYRLQRQQNVADLDSEQLEAAELGWKLATNKLWLTTAVYTMKKRHLILRETNAFNVSNGSTTHRGFEYEARWRFIDALTLSAAGTYARHEYAFSRAVEGGETITDGNDVDTAPRHLHTVSLDARFNNQWQGGIDGVYVGSYFVDAANRASYPGHKVANMRLSYAPQTAWGDISATLRVDNIFDTAYADRADFAFGNYRYFPARGRAVFLSIDYLIE